MAISLAWRVAIAIVHLMEARAFYGLGRECLVKHCSHDCFEQSRDVTSLFVASRESFALLPIGQRR